LGQVAKLKNTKSSFTKIIFHSIRNSREKGRAEGRIGKKYDPSEALSDNFIRTLIFQEKIKKKNGREGRTQRGRK